LCVVFHDDCMFLQAMTPVGTRTACLMTARWRPAQRTLREAEEEARRSMAKAEKKDKRQRKRGTAALFDD